MKHEVHRLVENTNQSNIKWQKRNITNKTMTKFKLGDRVRIKLRLSKPIGAHWWTLKMDKFQLDEFIVDGFDSIWNIIYGIHAWHPDWLELVDEFKEWEIVLVRDHNNGKWCERIYLCTMPWNAYYKYVCVHDNSEEEYKNWEEFDTSNWRQIKKIETKTEEMTMEQLEKELGRMIKIIN